MTRARLGGVLFLVVLAVAVLVAVWLLLTRVAPPFQPGTVRGGVGAPLTMDEFKIGLACRESRGDYEARNERTGAIGKYQILPVNWRVWSRRWLGDPRAEPTPENQELVADKKLAELARSLPNWAVVAHWWLTGSEDVDRGTWSDYANSYVDVVLGVARASQTTAGRSTILSSCFSTPDDPAPAAPPTHAAPATGGDAAAP